MVLAAVVPAPVPFPTTSGPASQHSKSAVISDTFAEVDCQSTECDLGAGVGPAAGSAAVAHAASGTVQSPRPLCQFRPDPSFVPPPTMSPADAHAGEAGSWMLRQCSGPAIDVMGRASTPTVGEVVWVPKAAPLTPSALAQVAYKQLKPPTPTLVLSPPNTRPELVGMPLWLSIPAASWAPVTASASAGGVSVTATAEPVSVMWSMGDGGSVTCRGPGTPYPSDPSVHPPLLSSTCGYTYERPTATPRDKSFPVTATVDWQVTWSGTGNSGGTFPNLRTSSGTQVQVAEVQALVTNVSS
ncbi:hypothetical protein ABH926_010085 [Catenulispora sp. GP43]